MTDHFEVSDLKTAAKIVILEEYIDIYTTIMDSNWSGERWYIDSHAGTGRTKIRDYDTTIDGSTIVALDNHTDSFDKFYFYELDGASFEKLHETIADKFGYEFEVGPVRSEGEDFTVARCDDPYIRIMQTDSNKGMQFLADHSNRNNHWFVFVDPKGLTAKRSTLDTLIDRSNLDLLVTYQTSGAHRNAGDDANHAHDAMERTMGDEDWPDTDDRNDIAEAYKEKLEENESIRPVKKKELVNPNDKRMRFDLVFACENETAREIMKEDIMDQDGLWNKANDKVGQSGLDGFT